MIKMKSQVSFPLQCFHSSGPDDAVNQFVMMKLSGHPEVLTAPCSKQPSFSGLSLTDIFGIISRNRCKSKEHGGIYQIWAEQCTRSPGGRHSAHVAPCSCFLSSTWKQNLTMYATGYKGTHQNKLKMKQTPKGNVWWWRFDAHNTCSFILENFAKWNLKFFF